jgi:putative flippase GtrA
MNFQELFSKKKSEQTSIQMARYFIIAGIATVFDYLIYLFTLKQLSISYSISIVIGFSIGVVVNYFLSNLWSFQRKNEQKASIEFTLFCLTGIFGIGINILVVYLLKDFLNINEDIGRIPAIGIAFIWNFFSKKWFVYK